MKTIELIIDGMHCEGCSNRLERVLNNLEGIKIASVTFESKIAKVEFDEEKIKQQEIKEAIIDAGFEINLEK